MCCLLLAFTRNYTEAFQKKTSVMKLVNLRGFYLVFQYKDIYWNLQKVHKSKIFLLHKNQNIKSKRITKAVLGSAKTTGIHTIVISGKKKKLQQLRSCFSSLLFVLCAVSFRAQVCKTGGRVCVRQIVLMAVGLQRRRTTFSPVASPKW